MNADCKVGGGQASIHIENGEVYIDPEKCNGCRLRVCPLLENTVTSCEFLSKDMNIKEDKASE